MPLRHARAWRATGFALVGIVLVLALVPLPELAVPGGDKAEHAVTFAGLAVWFLGAWQGRHGTRVAAGLLALGALIEALQAFVPWRSAELADLAADAVGIAAGWALAAAGLRGWCGWAERWLVRPQ